MLTKIAVRRANSVLGTIQVLSFLQRKAYISLLMRAFGATLELLNRPFPEIHFRRQMWNDLERLQKYCEWPSKATACCDRDRWPLPIARVLAIDQSHNRVATFSPARRRWITGEGRQMAFVATTTTAFQFCKTTICKLR
jgi:hypothetical protein